MYSKCVWLKKNKTKIKLARKNKKQRKKRLVSLWCLLHVADWLCTKLYGGFMAVMKGGTRTVCLHMLWAHLRGICNHKHTVGHAQSISWGVTHLCLLWTMEVVLLLPNPPHSNTLPRQLRLDLFFILAYLTKNWSSCSCTPWKCR